MQFPSKLLCLTLLLSISDSVTPQTLQSSYEAGELPDFEKRKAVGKARVNQNILFILTDDQGIGSDS
jgi:hypothetical protein